MNSRVTIRRLDLERLLIIKFAAERVAGELDRQGHVQTDGRPMIELRAALDADKPAFEVAA